MPSTFFGLQIGSSALSANQTALDVTSNNISNMNTAGYSRQQVNLTEGTPYTLPGIGSPMLGQLGTGVDLTSVTRIRNQYIDQNIWSSTSDQSAQNTLTTELTQAQNAFGEPSTSGLSAQLNNFFNAFSTLSANPQDMGLRTTLLDTAQSLTSQFHSVSNALTSLGPQINQQIGAKLGQVNQLASQIATLNGQIEQSLASGQTPNDLMDQRGQMITQLSQLVGVQTTNETNPVTGQTDGAININVGGFALVQGSGTNALPTTTSTHNGVFGVTTASGTFVPVQSGQLYGLMKANSLITGYQNRLDTLASTLITQVNSIQSTGAGLDGSTGINFFNAPPPPGTGAAADITVNPQLISNPAQIAAATLPAPPATPAPGNGDNATAMFNLANQTVLGSDTIGSYYNNTVAQVGSDTQTYQNLSNNTQQVLLQMQNQQSSISGVNMDEELTKMLQYQRSYEAAARVVDTADTFVSIVINNLGSSSPIGP